MKTVKVFPLECFIIHGMCIYNNVIISDLTPYQFIPYNKITEIKFWFQVCSSENPFTYSSLNACTYVKNCKRILYCIFLRSVILYASGVDPERGI